MNNSLTKQLLLKEDMSITELTVDDINMNIKNI